DSGYHFVNWTVTGVTLADNTNSAAAFAMPAGAVTITANFEKDAAAYALTVAAGAGGSVSGTVSGKYAEGYAVNVTATADSGYHFVNWTATGVTLADNTNSAAAFAMPAGGVTITANFEKDAAELSGDAALALLAADGFALSPAFDPDVNFYALTVEYGVANVTIRAAARSGKAEVTGGVGTSALAVGGNTFIIYVKAENGDINAYTVTVTRKAAPVFTVTVKSMAAKVGKPLQIPYVYDGSGPLAFTSSNPAVCGVGQTGILTPMKAGTAVITISAPGFPNYVFAVTVTN
ncbi:MAG: cadherin-like beta sandwich domain-containing protein, partial [Firmicutes bacterium]|nr:cadherin-like beta sandwich domain-containing protein [Bacillota bacterium]